MRRLLLFIVFFALAALAVAFVRADEYDDIVRQIDSLKKDLASKESSYQQLNTRLNAIKARVSGLESEIVKKEVEVEKGEKALTYQQNLLNERAKSYYKNSTKNSLDLVTVLTSSNLSASLRDFFYQKSLVDEDKNTIIKVVLYIKNLEEIKNNLEKEKTQLSSLKQEVDAQSKILAGQISQTRTQIAQLSARQEQLIAQKQASLHISRSASAPGRCDSDLTNGRDPGFSPRFAIFTYGVPNRIGLNQYGAKMRASFQGHEDILRAYYNDINFETRDNINIKVQGHGEMAIETYMLGICEMPESWPIEALKAQAIAARSYALAYTNNGANEICTTESCQVYCGEKTGAWRTAVQETAGKIMTQGGNPIKAWYSSTHGGYVFSSSEIGWSGTSWTKRANDFEGAVGSFADLNSKAYDRESPWFYCDWGSRPEYNKTAWLKSEELADIVNIILLVKADSSTSDHLYQVDKPNPAGTDTWGFDKVRQELRSRGITPFTSISGGSATADFSSGRSTSVSFSGDGGSASFSASEFKDWFNLRAPANIQIVGPLFNVEKR